MNRYCCVLGRHRKPQTCGAKPTPTLCSDLLPCLLRGWEGVQMSLTPLGVGWGLEHTGLAHATQQMDGRGAPDLGQLAPCRTQDPAGVDTGGSGLGNRVPGVPGTAQQGRPFILPRPP